MKSLWNDQDAAKYKTDLALRVYTSRLLGQNPSLVLHGGGNTSVKIRQDNIVGETEEILYVKGSGWDLATIEEGGFSGVRIPHLLKLAQLRSLSDSQMVNELKTQMIRSNAPSPSVETILHAILPYKYVDHTHADAVVTITNTAERRQRIKEIYGDRIVIIPYIMPGFDLARLCVQEFEKQKGNNTIGMVLMNHGIFSFGNTAKESYERMIELVTQAEDYLKQHQAWHIPQKAVNTPDTLLGETLAQLRYQVSVAAGFPVILSLQQTEKTLSFAQREDINIISQQGPATPDHVIRTKRTPLVGRDVQGYVKVYETYFKTNLAQAKDNKTMVDPAPRVIIDPELGMCAIGKNAKAAGIVADIYNHTIDIIQRGTLLGGYQALPSQDIFDVEYWELEQAKLAKGGQTPPFTGEVALVTGAASGIGKACVASLLKRGAAVVGLDINESITDLHKGTDFCGLVCDLTDETAIKQALEMAVRRFGGVDMVILNAGIFPASSPISALSTEQWRRIMNINLDANLVFMREVHPFLKMAPKGGRIVVIGSKNVPAPGPGAAAYSASKAALNQLTRVAALEWGKDKIRINSIHPNGVFDTGIWTDEVLETRAKNYGLTIEEYKTNNVLKVEVTSHDVAELAASMCDRLFEKTTAAQVPLDGGNERVI
ncbi:putative short-chain dehydrogenase/reductase SDR [Crocosphaera subtropica ATCC 51142]|uniref:Short-chain dehydrogenase/reductase SDR n=1 Tax=Crocosphaera subtropica (strain ATCC 51142 / BH68) TaxID=43989 RepID=B1WSB7_CROS5|nr:bifunctional aldolase/short-chain dehydrogenase [Crocosphaera subtropica]ACB51903.1 putative short-chain dehydrogenase/reductase SDR [Crocosphaera subtropica ATCC 51142]